MDDEEEDVYNNILYHHIEPLLGTVVVAPARGGQQIVSR